MPKILTPLGGLAAAAFMCLMPATLPETHAQQKAAPASKQLSIATLSIEELKSRRAAIESMPDIDAAVRTDSLKYIDQAVTYLELAERTGAKIRELSQIVQAAPARLKNLSGKLKKPFKDNEKVALIARKMSILDIEQQLRQKEAELSAAQARLRKWDDRLSAEKTVIAKAPEKLAAEIARLGEIQTELKASPEVPEGDLLNHSRVLSLKSELEKSTAEIQLIEMRQRSHNLLLELFSMERDAAAIMVEHSETSEKTWQAKVQERRRQEAARAREDAQDAIIEIPLMPEIVQDHFYVNVKLSAELEEITRRESEREKEYTDHQTRLKTLEAEYESARKRVASAAMTETIGLALRTQRFNLPAVEQYVADSKARQIRMSEISERLIVLNRLQDELSDPRALADHLIDSAGSLSKAARKSLDKKIQESITSRRDILQRLESGYNRIFRLIQDIEFSEQQLVSTAEVFGTMLDRHLIWIRSSKPLRLDDAQKLAVSFRWLFDPAKWGQLLKATGQSFQRNQVAWMLGLLVALLLMVSRRWVRNKLKEIATCVERQVEDAFLLTLKALGLMVILAAFWPFLLAFSTIQITALQHPDHFSKAIAGGLRFALHPTIFLSLMYSMCLPYSLAQVHFQWPQAVRQTLRSHLNWLTPIIVVTSFVLGAMESSPEHVYSDTLAKLALLVQSLAAATFTACILRFRGGITSVLIKNHPKTWSSRLRYVWYPLAVLSPLCILWLVSSGYYYSALEIRNLLSKTVWLAMAVIVFNSMAMRMLVLARRRIALKKAYANQALRMTEASGAEESTDSGRDSRLALMESILKMSDIDDQTRSLVKLVVFILTLMGTWIIWEPVFPALGILQEIQFWSYTTVVDGVEQTVPITLANLLLAGIVTVTTIIAVRNLPGLLEVILLNHLPLDPGARYAYSTVCRYAITALGIVVALNAIGIRWANLQWLVAALSVGIGFGLQEVVANFICGLIVLFERPFRVGDTVTVGDVHGTVTRIRMRATTIEDWDRKELIVPNKEFIIGQLINWTLTDHVLRMKVPVGIAYGSDTDLVEKLLLKAARENSMVLKSPEPTVVFRNFGDNTLDFEVRVFIKNIDDRIPMLHAINRAIDKKFREAGITIAFPQRDVHLDTTGPLDIRVVPNTSSGSGADS